MSLFGWYILIGIIMAMLMSKSIKFLLEKQKLNPEIRFELSSLENEMQKFYNYTGKYFWVIFNGIFILFWLPMLVLYAITKIKKT